MVSSTVVFVTVEVIDFVLMVVVNVIGSGLDEAVVSSTVVFVSVEVIEGVLMVGLDVISS